MHSLAIIDLGFGSFICFVDMKLGCLNNKYTDHTHTHKYIQKKRERESLDGTGREFSVQHLFVLVDKKESLDTQIMKEREM